MSRSWAAVKRFIVSGSSRISRRPIRWLRGKAFAHELMRLPLHPRGGTIRAPGASVGPATHDVAIAASIERASGGEECGNAEDSGSGESGCFHFEIWTVGVLEFADGFCVERGRGGAKVFQMDENFSRVEDRMTELS